MSLSIWSRGCLQWSRSYWFKSKKRFLAFGPARHLPAPPPWLEVDRTRIDRSIIICSRDHQENGGWSARVRDPSRLLLLPNAKKQKAARFSKRSSDSNCMSAEEERNGSGSKGNSHSR